MKCPECGNDGEIDEFETDDLDDRTDIMDKDYIHVCPVCMYHFLKEEG